MLNPKVLAKYIVDAYEKYTNDEFNGSELRLHKLMYFAQREALAVDGEPLFDGDFEGWVYGPVLPELRFYFNDFEAGEGIDEEIDDRTRYIVANVLDQYAKFAAWTLRDMSHEEYSWKKSREGLAGNDHGNKIIPIEDIMVDANSVRLYDSQWGMYVDEFEDYEC